MAKEHIHLLRLNSGQRAGTVHVHNLQMMEAYGAFPELRYFSLDVDHKTWTYRGQTFQIGEELAWQRRRESWYPILGVYDLSSTQQVNAMVWDAQRYMSAAEADD